MSFRGLSSISIQDGRLSLPSKVREVMELKYADCPNLVLSRSLNSKFLVLFPETVWELFAEDLPEVTREDRAKKFQIVGTAENLRLDKAGRIVIPRELREKVCLSENSEVVVIGMRDRVFIMSKEQYLEREEKADAVDTEKVSAAYDKVNDDF